MIPQISNALSSGFTSSQIITFLMRQFPSQSKKIQKAMASGFSAEQILKFLSGGKKGLAQEEPEINTSHARARNLDIQRRENVNKTALGAAGAGALAIGGSLAAPMAGQALQRAAPQLFGPGSIVSPQAPITTANVANSAIQTTQGMPHTQGGLPPLQSPHISSKTSAPPGQSNIPLTPEAIQPEIKPINVSEILNKYPGFQSKINDMMRSKNTPEAIAQYFKQFNASQTKKLEKEAGVPIEEIINQYMQSSPQEERGALSREEALGKFRDKIMAAHENETQEPTNMESQGQELEETQETPKVEPGHTVASPHGIGEIKAIRNGKAIIEIDGKKHQVDEDELIQSPIPEKDLADLYDDLISGIEKTTGKQVSRNVDWAGYDPTTNELAYKPHGSDKLYAYEDIAPEDVDLLTSLLTQRKSTGENFIGAWQSGSESPIGAAMYQLIKKLQGERGGKGSEYKNKYETIYDALEPAKKAAKERHAERKKKAKKPRPH